MIVIMSKHIAFTRVGFDSQKRDGLTFIKFSDDVTLTSYTMSTPPSFINT